MAARRRSKRDLHVVVTEGDGTVTSLLVARGGFNQIRKNPISGLGQVVTTGDGAARSDQRTPQIIWTDQTGGMGEFEYVETAGIATFRTSQCDTRFPGLITLPPRGTRLGVTNGLTYSVPAFAQYLNVTSCHSIAWVQANSATTSARRWDGAAWNTVTTGGTGISNLTSFCQYRARYCFGTTNNTIGLYTSTDAVTWANSAKAKAIAGLCVHDNKIYAFNSTDNTLDWATDATAAHASWTASSVLYLYPDERVNQLVEWRDRVGRAVVYVVTTRRLLQYDEDADTFLDFYDFSGLSHPTTTYPRATAHPGDGNLYLNLHDTATAVPTDTLIWFSGTTNQAGPNQRGGLDSGQQVGIIATAGGTRWLYCFGYPRGINQGAVLAMNSQQAFSTVAPGGLGVSTVIGGGYARGHLIVLSKGTLSTDMYADDFTVPDTPETPLFAAGTYPTFTAYTHEFSFTDGGTPNMAKQALWLTLVCRDHTDTNKVPGLAATTAVTAYYRRPGDSSWTSLGQVTHASTFPAVLPFGTPAGNGVAFKEIQIRLDLYSETSTSTPIVTSVALAYTRQEVPRYAYTVPIDLSDRTHPLYRGKGIAQLLAAMDRWAAPGALVKFQMAGGDYGTAPSTSTTVQNATFAYSGVEDAERGPGIYQGIFADFSYPASG